MTRIFRRDATDLGPAGNMEPFGLAFLDPPYGQGLGEKALAVARRRQLARAGRRRRARGSAEAEIVTCRRDFTELDRRTYGDTQVIFARYDLN